MNKDKFKDIKFKKPEVPPAEQKKRLTRMVEDLLNMIGELKKEYEQDQDGNIKEQLKTAIESLEKLKNRVNNSIH